MEIVAVVVARKGSTRIKSKSMLKLGEDTLIERKIKQLKQCHNINKVIFGSDCDEMIEIARVCGASVVKRPDYYCDENKASANEMIANMMSLIEADIVVWAHCTNPLITTQTYEKAIDTFISNNNQFDSLISVVELKEHLWKTDKSMPINYNPYAKTHTPARNLPPFYMQDGGIFIQPYQQMKQNSYFFGKKPYLFEIPKEEFLDINEMRDYLLAKSIIEDSSYMGGGSREYKIISHISNTFNASCLSYLNLNSFDFKKAA